LRSACSKFGRLRKRGQLPFPLPQPPSRLQSRQESSRATACQLQWSG
jgi:hypothetical protein